MSSNLGNLVATATLDIAPFMTNTKNLKTYMRGLDSSMKAVENSLKGQSNKLNGLKTLYAQTGTSLKGYQSILAKQSEHFNKLKNEIGDVSTATAEQKNQLVGAQAAMTETAAKVAELQNRYNALGKEIAIQSSVFTQFGEHAIGFGNKLTSIGESMSSVGSAFTRGVTVPLVSGAGLAVKAAVDFETAFAGVKKTVDETATVSYKNLSDGIRQMAKELPASAVEIANVAEAAGQLGIKTEDVLSFTRTMIDLGESTNLSATDAASAIAKVANITGLTADEYSRFGSSVVALGNNFATTESDIVSMANRLASAGTLAGLTNQEILGLATAMSSVGIEAEAGGTAMTQTLTAIEKAVTEAGSDLHNFAGVAGMTSEEFATAWQTKPVEALQAFIKGLGELDKEGGSATLTLEELGLSGIRQSNMLKSLALASDTMTDAVNLSNKAWSENTTLTDEANKRYETTEAKLGKLRNEVTDVAIEFGGPLVDALRDGLEAGKPLIEKLGEMAKAFSALDKEQQQSIIKWGLFAAGIGPVFSVLGKGASVLGSVSRGLGTVSKMLGGLSGAKKVATGIEAVATAGAGAETALTGMATAGTALGGLPIWGLIIGGAVAAGLALWAHEAGKAEARTKEWGTAVSATEADALSRFKTKVDETNEAMVLFERGAEKVDTVKKAFDDLAGSIEKLVNEELSKDLDLAEKFGLSENVTNVLKERAQGAIDNVRRMTTQVKEIYDRHNGDVSKLTQAEKELVLRNQNEMIQEQLKLMNFSASERKALTQAINGDLDRLNLKQLDKALKNTTTMLDEENKSYKTKKQELKDILEAFGDDVSKLSQKELEARREVKGKLEELETEHNLKTKALKDQWVDIQRERVDKLRQSGKDQELIQFELAAITQALASEMGISYQEASELLSQSVDKSTEKLGILSNNTKNATAEVAKANEAWDSLFTSANPQESLNQLLSTAQGWNDFEIMVKNADVNPIGRASLAEMLVAGGQWQNMTLDQKLLVVDGNQAMVEIFNSKDLLEKWQALTPEQKKLVAENLTAEPTLNAQTAIDNVKQKESVKIKAKDETTGEVEKANQSVNSPKQKQPISILGRDDTGPSVAKVNASVNSPRQVAPVSMLGRDDTGPQVAQANKAVNSPKQNSPVSMSAIDNTSIGVSSAQASVNSVQDRTVYITTVHQVVGGKTMGYARGTNHHPGGLAMVNDQKGPMYKELVTLPTGESFILKGRDVILPLPKGSKVLPASATKRMMEDRGIFHYAKGVGYSKNSPFLRSYNEVTKQVEKEVITERFDDESVSLLRSILKVMTHKQQLDINVSGNFGYSDYDIDKLTQIIANKIADEIRRQQQLKGVSMWRNKMN